MNNDQLIQDYIANRLSEQERIKVENLLETDMNFKSEFESYKDISMAFKISEANDLKAHFKQLEENSPNKKSGFIKLKYAYLAIASAILIGFFYNIFNEQSGDDLFNSNFEIYPNTYQPITRSNSSNESNKAFLAYENKDFSTAEQEFQSLLKSSNNPNIRFYYALALLNQSKDEKALEQFKILKNQTHDYLPEALWYSALIYIKSENYKSAKQNLEQLSAMESKFNLEKTRYLLRTLKD